MIPLCIRPSILADIGMSSDDCVRKRIARGHYLQEYARMHNTGARMGSLRLMDFDRLFDLGELGH